LVSKSALFFLFSVLVKNKKQDLDSSLCTTFYMLNAF